MARDPVCHMEVEPEKAAGQFAYRGETYYFCNPRCLEKFRADPAKYLTPAKAVQILPTPQAKLAPQGKPPAQLLDVKQPLQPPGDYTCPMHPEVRLPATEPCPKCGMALEPVVSAPAARTEYVCPMHPEMVRPEPGSCPICGMALEPRVVTAQEEVSPELVDMTRRFWISVALSAPVVFLEMSAHIPGQPV